MLSNTFYFFYIMCVLLEDQGFPEEALVVGVFL